MRTTLFCALLALTAVAGCGPQAGSTGGLNGDSGAGSEPAAILVTGGTVVTMGARPGVIEDGAVAIEGERIVAVGSAAELASGYPGARTIDAAGKIVMPGLINTHTHVPMTLFRGIADDLELMEWLETVIFPAEAANVDEEFVRWGTRLACLEMLRGGTTTFVDMYYFEDAIAEEAVACGMRSVAGETLIGFPAPDNPTWEEAVAYTDAFLRKWKGHPLVTPAVAPHSIYTLSGEQLQEAHRLAIEHDVPLLMHLAEHSSEAERVPAAKGMGAVEYAHALGLLEPRLTAAHMIWPSAGEIELLRASEVGVAHCPESNMKIAAGVAPVPRLLAAGIPVGLGTDGPASNNDLDLWEEIDTAAKLHKVMTGDPTVVNARQAIEMATLGGARALNMERDIGSLEVGKRADVILVDVGGVHQQPLYDVYSVLAYATDAADVDTVIVNGRVVVEGGVVLTVDEAAVLSRAETYRQQVLESLANR